jgi:hypothetical protein
MKGVLHVKFLQNCRAEDVIPKGLSLKLKLTVGGMSNKLQEKVDSLLHRVSVEDCELIKEDHMRRSNEKSRTTIEKRHAKKLNFLKENVSITQPLITEKTQSDDWQIKTSKKRKELRKQKKSQ